MFLFFSGECCEEVTLGTMANGPASLSFLSGTYTLDPTIKLIYDRNVYKNGDMCMYWYGPRKQWWFNYCKDDPDSG